MSCDDLNFLKSLKNLINIHTDFNLLLIIPLNNFINGMEIYITVNGFSTDELGYRIFSNIFPHVLIQLQRGFP